MAEATTLRNNALPYPIYAEPFALVLQLLDSSGVPVAESSPDSERSLNGDTAADCTNEFTAISGMTGRGYLALTGTELTCDILSGNVKSTGAVDTPFELYPRKLPKVRSGTSASAGSSTSTIVLDSGASTNDDYYNGMVVACTIDSVRELRTITDYVGATKAATVVPDWNTAPDNNDPFDIYLPDGVQIQQANTTLLAGNPIYLSDFTVASATSSTVTLPTTKTDGSTSIPDDDRYVYTCLEVVAGTGVGQLVVLTTAAAGARVYNIASGSCPVTLDNTSQCVIRGAAGQFSYLDAAITSRLSPVALPANFLSMVVGSDGYVRVKDDAGNAVASAAALNTVDDFLDTEIAAIKTKTDFLPSATAGGSGGLLIAGSNAATSFDAITVTGAVLANDGSNDITVTTVTNQMTAADVRSAVGLASANLDTQLSGINAKTTNLPASPAAVGSAMTLASGAIVAATFGAGAIDAAALATDAITSAELSATATAEIAAAVWDLATTGHTSSGTFGEAMQAAGSAGDPWATALPGAYGSGTAGNIIGNRLDAAVTSRMATYTQPTGFLAATFPATVASPTNITGGTITTVTNLTNAPTSGDFTSTMKTSIGTAVAASAVASVTAGVTIATDGLAAASVSTAAANKLADALLDRADAIEVGVTPRGSFRLISSAAAGKISGAGTGTMTFRNAVADSKDRIIANVSSGNRTSITYDLT